ncbi:putative phage-type endonuclease [Desulfonispora thiosulfatigenes DSM 11270]|uniref:Putative phage-type endonuclease n=1 Tax=Desulfonispora thiosulfatigenes DSM 11270 TaxID=656914 RepID=A0A1W1VQZ3_DESTI|nr:YqaJ viral recombinase family protein [Desulfonispora thiosulfatigenes]SMB95511.1 putative phage-type endonuclease [Desulfonispora thiosulfatigenes DSM 11270]
MQAITLVSTKDMDHGEWLKWRQKGIGGSDAAAIAGLNPWKSPISVYLDKIGQGEEVEDNERMRVGRDLEDYVATRFEEATGLKVRKRNAILAHSENEFMFANVDRLVVGEKEGLECKTTNSYSRKDWEDDNIPAHYEIQCHHYMAVTGYKAWWIACLIGNEKFVYKKIERDEEIINYLIKIEKDFWENHIVPKIIPAPDGSEDAGNLIKMMYPNSTPDSFIDLEDDYINHIDRRAEIAEMIKKLELEKSQIEQVIQVGMGDFETAIIRDKKVTWKTINSNRFDSKEFKKDYPDLYDQYVNTSSYRRFQIK